MLNEASSNEPLGEAMGCEVSVVQEALFCHHYQSLSLARQPALWRILVVLQHSMLQKSFRSVPRYNPVSEVYRQFLELHGLVCALACTVNCGTLVRAFPNHVQSTEFTTGGETFNTVVETSAVSEISTQPTTPYPLYL